MWDTRHQQAPQTARKPKQWDGYNDSGGFDDGRSQSAPRDRGGGGGNGGYGGSSSAWYDNEGRGDAAFGRGNEQSMPNKFFDEGERRSGEFSGGGGGGGAWGTQPPARASADNFFDEGRRNSGQASGRDGFADPPPPRDGGSYF